MILKSALAAGLVLAPPAPQLIVPKPAIIKPENIELSKHLLAMPLTMGMLPGKVNAPPRTITYRGSSSFASLATHTYSASIGTASSDRLVVALVAYASPSINLSSVTIAGSAPTTYAMSTGGATKGVIAYLVVTSGTTASIVASYSGAVTGAIGVYTIALGTTSATAFARQRSSNSAITTLDVTIAVPSGGVVVAMSNCLSSTAAGMGWVNATQGYALDYAPRSTSGASGTTSGTITITATGLGSTGANGLVAASW